MLQSLISSFETSWQLHLGTISIMPTETVCLEQMLQALKPAL